MNQLRLAFLTLLAGALIFSSCNNDDDEMPSFNEPTVTGPSGVTEIETGQSGTVSFDVTVDPGVSSASYNIVASEVTVTSDVSGNVPTGSSTLDVNFIAGNVPGSGSIELTVTDSEGQSEDDVAVINIGGPEIELVSDNITADATWTADKVWVLAGRIAVEPGVTLTIEPGTVIKGATGIEQNAKALLVARGATLIAEGTPELPIIFTALADRITPSDVANGDFASPNLDPTLSGQWGGVLVLGRAPISASNENGDDVSEVQIEGIPTSDPLGLYGGDDPMDNSGSLKYISIRHGGASIGAGNEINGLTLGGVGSETTIENIEIVANQDDGIEWFGGNVNVTNAVVWNAGDDAIDTDQAWSGTLDNFVVVTPNDRSFELDGPEGSMSGKHTIQNGSVIASDEASGLISGNLINVDDNSEVNLIDIYFTGIVGGATPQEIVQSDSDEINAPEVSFEGIVLDVEEADLSNHVKNPTVPNGITAGQTPKADVSGLGWTWANIATNGFEGLK